MHYRGVCECGNNYFSKCFFVGKCIKIIYIFLKLFLISTHQNYPKKLKKKLI